MPPPNARGHAGFTLVELLVALLLFGMLSLALFAALRGAAGALARVAANTAGTNGLAAADTLLRRNLSAAYPLYIAAPGTPGHIAFDGQARSVAFLAPAPAALAAGGFAGIAIALVNKNLVIAARPELSWPDAPPALQEILAPNIADANFAYFGPDPGAAAPYWHNSWQHRAVLPSLIRLHVTFPPGDPRHWPDFIFATAIRADQTCQFVPLTQSCLGR